MNVLYLIFGILIGGGVATTFWITWFRHHPHVLYLIPFTVVSEAEAKQQREYQNN